MAWDINAACCSMDDCLDEAVWLCRRHETVYCEAHADVLESMCPRCSDPMVEF